MARRKQPNQGAKPEGKALRFTYLMPPAVERNLAIYAFKAGLTKQESITRALERLLRDAGLDPTKMPTVSVTYPDGD